MKVEEVQSRCASVVHRNGQNMSAAQTTAAVPGSIASFIGRRAQTTSVPPGAEAFTAGTVDIPATATAAAVRTTVRVPVPADVPATAPDAEALTAELLVCGEPECEKQPCIAESGQTTTGKPKFCFLHSTSGDTCLECGGENLQPLLSHPLSSHPRLPIIWQQDSFETTVITSHVITPLRYTTRGGE